MLAISISHGRVAPVFDVAKNFLLFSGEVEKRLFLDDDDFENKISALKENDVDEIICGAITNEALSLLLENQIKVNSFISGDIEEIKQALKSNLFNINSFAMPGCGRKRRKKKFQNTKNRPRNRACKRQQF